MKRRTKNFTAVVLLCLLCSIVSQSQTTLYLTSSGGSFPTETWMEVTTLPNGGGTQIWGQGNGTYGDSPGLVTDENIVINCGTTYYINAYDKYDDTWNGGTYELWTGPGKTGTLVANNGGAVPDDGNDDDASSAFNDTQAQELEVSEAFSIVCPCTFPSAGFTVVADCGNGQYSIDVNVTALGDGTGVDITDGTTTFETNVGTGTYTVGPFTAGVNKTIEVEGTSYGGCDISSSSLTENCACATDPVATTSTSNLDCSLSTYDINVTVTNFGSGTAADIYIDNVLVQASAVLSNAYTFNSYATGTHTVTIKSTGGAFVLCETDYNVNEECNGSDAFDLNAPDILGTCLTGDLSIATVDGPTDFGPYCTSGGVAGMSNNFVRNCSGTFDNETDFQDIWYQVDLPDGTDEMTLTVTGLGANEFVGYILHTADPGGSSANNVVTATGDYECTFFSTAVTSHTITGLAGESTAPIYIRIAAFNPNQADACGSVVHPSSFSICASAPQPNDICNDALEIEGTTQTGDLTQANAESETSPDVNGTSCGGSTMITGEEDLWYTVTVPQNDPGRYLEISVTFEGANDSAYFVLEDYCSSGNVPMACEVLKSTGANSTVTTNFGLTELTGSTLQDLDYKVRVVKPTNSPISNFSIEAKLIATDNWCSYFNQVTINYRLHDGTNPVSNVADFNYASNSGELLPDGSTPSATNYDLWYIVDPVLTTDGNGLNTWSGNMDFTISGLQADENLKLVIYRRNGYSGNCGDYSGDFVSEVDVTSNGTTTLECLDMTHGSVGVGDGYIVRVIQTAGAAIASPTISATPDSEGPPSDDLCSMIFDGTSPTFIGGYYNITNDTIAGDFDWARNCDGYANGLAGGSSANDRDLWYVFTIPTSSCPDITASSKITTANLYYNANDAFRDGYVYVYNACHTDSAIACQAIDGAGGTFTATGLEPGTTYLVRVMPHSLNSNIDYAFEIGVELGPERACNDYPSNAVALGMPGDACDLASLTTYSAQGATITSGAKNKKDVWFTFTAPNPANGGPYVSTLSYLSLYVQNVSGHGLTMYAYELGGEDNVAGNVGSLSMTSVNVGSPVGSTGRLHLGHLIPGKQYYIGVGHNELDDVNVQYKICAYVAGEDNNVIDCNSSSISYSSGGLEDGCLSDCHTFFKVDLPETQPSGYYRFEVIGDAEDVDIRVRYQGSDAPSVEGDVTDIDHPCNAGVNVGVEASGNLADPGTCNGGTGEWKVYNLIGPAVGMRNYFYLEVMDPVDVIDCGGINICEINMYGPYATAAEASTLTSTDDNLSCSVLPLEILSFSGKSKNGYNEISWNVAFEEVENIQLERSLSDLNYEVVHDIKIYSAHFEDDNIDVNKSYFYRIKSKEAYSEVIKVERKGNSAYKVFPSVVHNEITILSQMEDDVVLQWVDQMGREVFSKEVHFANSESYVLKLGDNSPGIYYLMIKGSKSTSNHRVIVAD